MASVTSNIYNVFLRWKVFSVAFTLRRINDFFIYLEEERRKDVVNKCHVWRFRSEFHLRMNNLEKMRHYLSRFVHKRNLDGMQRKRSITNLLPMKFSLGYCFCISVPRMPIKSAALQDGTADHLNGRIGMLCSLRFEYIANLPHLSYIGPGTYLHVRWEERQTLFCAHHQMWGRTCVESACGKEES